MKHLEKHSHLFEVLKNASPPLRKVILEKADDGVICALAEIIVNLMQGNIRISSQQKRKLMHHKALLRAIVNQCSHKHPNKTKLRKKIIQTGGFLPFLLPLIPLIAKAALAGAVSTGVGVAINKIAG
jgi:hypothetical protein